MPNQIKRVLAFIAALAFMNAACFSSYRISSTELEKLQTGFEAEEVQVIIDGCEGASATGNTGVLVAQAGDGGPVLEEGIDPATGCPTIGVSATSAINVATDGGDDYRIIPFAFTINETQLVSPDYDLLLARDSLESADVEVFSTGKTIGLIAIITAAAAGAFVGITAAAGDSRGLGGSN